MLGKLICINIFNLHLFASLTTILFKFAKSQNSVDLFVVMVEYLHK